MEKDRAPLKKCSQFLALGFLGCLVFRFSLWSLELRHLARIGLAFPLEVDMALSFVMFASLVFIVMRGLGRISSLTVCSSLFLLMLSDTMRVHSWTYTYLSFFLIYGIGLWFAKDKHQKLVFRYWQWLTIAIYLWSGILKFNVAFINTVIPYLFDDFFHIPAELFVLLGLLIPFTEALFPILLLYPSTRPFGALGLFGMHFFILLVLGPFGKNISENIWAWNITMSFMVYQLFWLRMKEPRLSFPKNPLSAVFITIYFLLPPLHMVNLWNGNLSFNMFSGRLPDAVVYLSEESERKLPFRLQRIIQEDEGGRFISANKYAMDETSVYIYPSKNAIRAVTRDLCNTVKTGDVLIREIPSLIESEGKKENTSCEELLLESP